MTCATQGTNTEKLYQEFGLEPLPNRGKLRRLCLFYKIFKNHILPYLQLDS